MASSYVKAKQDKPGGLCVGNCMPGRYCQRWLVLTAADIKLCTLLPFDDGVLIKWTGEETSGFSGHLNNWVRPADDDVTINSQVIRQDGPQINGFKVQIGTFPFGFVSGQVLQDVNEMLIRKATITDLTIGPGWGVPDPISSMTFESFPTVAAAKAEYPDAWDWVWE